MGDQKSTKTWERTRKRHLLRHKSGRYYARAFVGGKEVWKSLDTSHFSIAEQRLKEFLNVDLERQKNCSNREVSPKMTFGEVAAIYIDKLDDKLAAGSIKPRTRDYGRECLHALQTSWPGLGETEIRKVTREHCLRWARNYRRTVSATRHNAALSVLRHLLEIGVKLGVVYRNVATAESREESKEWRAKLRPKHIALPSTEKFNGLLEEMRAVHSRDSQHCADFVQGLAVTGMRKGEANELEWRDVDFEAGEIVVRGDAETGTKNWEVRRVPMIPDARVLFQRMRSQRPDEALDAKVFLVRESQKSLDRACHKVGTARITHHDLRHLFATRCIESGVDIPTVSRWLGHKDGGALAMKTYGHLRREHSIAQAQRVTFALTPGKDEPGIIAFPKN